MAIPSRQDEYEDQLYGLSSVDLCDEVRDLIIEEFKNCSQVIHGHLVERQNSDEGKKAIEHAVSAMLDICIESSKGPLEALSKKLSDVFSLPPHVLLPEDEVQRERYTEADEEKERAALTQLASRFRRAQYLQAVYQKEIEKWKHLEPDLKVFKKTFTEIKKLETKLETDSSSSDFHELVQNVLGLEVENASLKLTTRPSCAESHIAFKNSVFDAYR